MNEEATDFTFSAETSGTGVAEDSPKPDRNSLLDALRTVIEQEVKRTDIEVPIPDRPGVSVVFSPNIEEHQLKAWRKQAGEGKKTGMDFMKFATVVIGQTCQAILFNGEEVTDEDGNSLNFASREILSMVDEDMPIPNGIKRFWGDDPHLQATSVTILDKAGWGEEAETTDREDPTKG